MQTLGSVITILGLIFLFWGEPDAWDALHAKVMGQTLECPKPPPSLEQKRNTFYF